MGQRAQLVFLLNRVRVSFSNFENIITIIVITLPAQRVITFPLPTDQIGEGVGDFVFDTFGTQILLVKTIAMRLSFGKNPALSAPYDVGALVDRDAKLFSPRTSQSLWLPHKPKGSEFW